MRNHPRQCTLEQRELAIKLIQALRSGEFKQGNNMLVQGTTDDPRYCCLGVAGLLVGYSREQMERMQLQGYASEEEEAISEPGTLLSAEAAARYGFTEQEQNELAAMNDGGEDFLRIADRVEDMFDIESKPASEQPQPKTFQEHLEDEYPE